MEQPILTQVRFTLPIGFQDERGTLHREGIMRLATAADEILPLRDHRVQENPAFFTVYVLQRVIVKLGTLEAVSTNMIESLFLKDFNYLQELYNEVNGLGDEVVPGRQSAVRGEGQPGNVEALPLRTSSTQR